MTHFLFAEPLQHNLIVVPAAAEVRIDRKASVRYRNAVFVTRVATFRDELFAYLMYQPYKSSTPFLDDELLLRYAAKK